MPSSSVGTCSRGTTTHPDEAFGPGPSAQSYLSIPRIIAAAEVTDVDAIHPGYGFLSENGEFADTCRDHGIEFIGPDGDTIRQLGDKATAREVTMNAKGLINGSRFPILQLSYNTVGLYYLTMVK